MEYNTRLYAALETISKKFEDLNKKIENPNIGLTELKNVNKQIKKNSEVVSMFLTYKKILNDAKQAEQIVLANEDPEFVEIAKSELSDAKNKLPKMEEKMQILLLPTDPNDDKNVIIEMRPAAGGDEASIFVADLFDCYKRYSDKLGWKIKILDSSANSHGYDYIFFSVSGESVYSKFKFESGVHRVQRVPATESKGRVHTSTITVAVLPEVDEVDFKINTQDLRVDTYRASGAGGQHVNRTESAVRITHIPTGIVASCQEGKSQIENRETAMKMLTSKIWEKLESDRQEKIDSDRKKQVGSGERSEKIRTYNYPQNRVTDHRINLSLNKLELVMQGALDEIIDGLTSHEQAELMNQMTI